MFDSVEITENNKKRSLAPSINEHKKAKITVINPSKPNPSDQRLLFKPIHYDCLDFCNSHDEPKTLSEQKGCAKKLIGNAQTSLPLFDFSNCRII